MSARACPGCLRVTTRPGRCIACGGGPRRSAFRDALARAHSEAEARCTAVVADAAFGRPAQYDDMNSAAVPAGSRPAHERGRRRPGQPAFDRRPWVCSRNELYMIEAQG